MPDPIAPDPMFQQLVLMFGHSAMQQLGKLVNPMSGKAEVDLEGAQASIDVLEMLERKTRGNLDPAETRMLGDVLTGLRLNYVEVAQSTPPAAAPTAEAPPAEPPPAEEKKFEAGPKTDGKDSTRFHKSYG